MKTSSERLGRLCLFLLIAVGLSWIGWRLVHEGWESTWRSWGMVSRSPFFSDLRVVTGSVDTVALGIDPMVQNPGAPYHQVFNQPRVWIWIFTALDLDEGTSGIVGVVFEIGVLVGLWWIVRGISLGAAFYCAALFFSPAVMLAFERCNNDLLLFFVLALAYALLERSIKASTGLVLAGFILKLFPLGGILLIFGAPPKQALRLGTIAVVVAIVYFALTWGDLTKMWQTTEKGGDVSYGYKVLTTYLQARQSSWAGPMSKVVAAATALGFALSWWFNRTPPINASRTGRELDAYRIGAGVYAGTFLLGNSWDYRLLFLFFLVPQLFCWLGRGSTFERVLAASQFASLLIAAWAQWTTYHLPNHFWLVRSTEEIAKGWLFLSSVYLLAYSLPRWARSWLRFDFRASPTE